MLFGPNDKLERLRLLSEKAKLANLFLTKKVLMKVYQLCSLNSISRSLHFDLNIKIRTLQRSLDSYSFIKVICLLYFGLHRELALLKLVVVGRVKFVLIRETESNVDLEAYFASFSKLFIFYSCFVNISAFNKLIIVHRIKDNLNQLISQSYIILLGKLRKLLWPIIVQA